MPGRKTYTRQEVVVARAVVTRQLKAYDEGFDAPASRARELESTYFHGMLLSLDRMFVHRTRMVTGTAGTPLNEAGMLVDSLIHNGGELRTSDDIDYDPATSVLGLELGMRIALRRDDFERLAEAFLAEIEEKFLA